jgi:hypothetical protein
MELNKLTNNKRKANASYLENPNTKKEHNRRANYLEE